MQSMGVSLKSNMMIQCQKTKDALNKNKKEFLDFVVKGLSSGNIVKAAEALLPFDNFVCAKLSFVDEASLIKSLGFSLMRMEVEPSTFSLGISIEISDSKFNDGIAQTMFVTAFHTLEELKNYSMSADFSKHVSEVFEAQIEDCFYSQKKTKVWDM